jgi:rhodanese-related sulfurtransferase
MFQEDRMERTIQPGELKEQLKARKDLILLDVRRKADYEASQEKLPGAEWRDPDTLDEWTAVLPRGKEVVVYCVRGGSVSNRVLDYLQEKNIQARLIEGGIEAWKASGGPVINKTGEHR